MNDKLFKTPFCTLSYCTLYSFISAGNTVKGPQDSDTIAIATVVQILNCRSCTFKLFNKVTRTSWGPIAFAIYPKVTTAALLILRRWAFNSSKRSKHILIHSLGDTSSDPLSAILPTNSIQFYCTFSFLFFKIGVNLGSRSLIGGVIFAIPTSITIYLRAPKMLPSTSGYSSRKLSFKFSPSLPNLVSSPHIFIQWAILETRSAACCLIRILLLLSLQLIVPTICTKYGFARRPKAFTIAANPFKTTASSLVC